MSGNFSIILDSLFKLLVIGYILDLAINSFIRTIKRERFFIVSYQFNSEEGSGRGCCSLNVKDGIFSLDRVVSYISRRLKVEEENVLVVSIFEISKKEFYFHKY